MSEVLRLARLATPVVVGQLGLMLLGVVDLWVIGPVDPDHLGAVGLGNTWSFATLVFGMGLVMGADTLLTQAYGREDPDAAGVAAWHTAIWAALVGTLITGVHLLAEPGMTLLGQPGSTIPDASLYAEIMGASVYPFLGFTLLRGLLQANGRMMAPTLVILLGNLVNLLGDGVLVWGLGFEVAGVAWVTVAVRWFMLLALVFVGREAILEAWPEDGLDIRKHQLARVADVAFPVAWQVSLEVWAFNATMFLAGWLGSEALNAHTAALNLSSLAFMLPLGLSVAASTRVGNLVGAEQDWRRAAYTSLAVGGGIMLVTGATYLLIPEALAGLYADDPVAIAAIAAVIPIAGVYGVFDGVQVVGMGVLRGLGDTRYGARVALFAYWGVTLPTAALASRWLGLAGLWWAICFGLATAAVLLLHRISRAPAPRT